MKMTSSVASVFVASTLALALCACSESSPSASGVTNPDTPSVAVSTTPSAVPASAPGSEGLDANEQQHLATFDDLDFNVFSNSKWDELSHSHAKDVLVHWPDGHTTVGIDVHIADLKKLFVYAPDTRIKQHPHRLAQGNLTAVTGVMEGTFTLPMPGPGGTAIPPTGKAFALPMATVGRWENGVMQEEWLYWDNQAYMNQIGLGK